MTICDVRRNRSVTLNLYSPAQENPGCSDTHDAGGPGEAREHGQFSKYVRSVQIGAAVNMPKIAPGRDRRVPVDESSAPHGADCARTNRPMQQVVKRDEPASVTSTEAVSVSAARCCGNGP